MEKRPFKSITQCESLKGTYVFLRASFNVPIKDGVIQNQFRIARGMATVQYLVKKGARVIVAGHIGRDGHISTQPIAEVLSKHVPTVFSPQVLGETTQQLRDGLQDGQVLLIENLRSDEREKKNDADFAQQLSGLADIYVNDAFAASHRSHASLDAITRFLPSFVGLNFVHEYVELSKARAPQSPALFLLGGAKFDTKMPLVEKLLSVYDTIFIGGALANDFFKAQGYEIGASLVSDVSLVGSPLLSSTQILLPIDVIVQKMGDSGAVRVCAPDAVQNDERILDAGPKTSALLEEYITKAKMVLWNGPLGNYEAGFEEQTIAVAKSIAQASGYSVVGGGDTIAAIESLQCQEKYNFLSTAGGAMLTFLETGTLPAIEALKKSNTT